MISALANSLNIFQLLPELSRVNMIFVRYGKRQKRCRMEVMSESPHLEDDLRRKRNAPKELALQNFDRYYKNTFGKDWHSIRLALLCQPKHCALVNNFAVSEETIRSLSEQECVNICLEHSGLAELVGETEVTRPTRIIDNEEGTGDDNSVTDLTLEHKSMKLEKNHLQSRIVRQAPTKVDPSAAAVLYEYVPVSTIKSLKPNELDEKEEFAKYQKIMKAEEDRFSVRILQNTKKLHFPKYLSAYIFMRGNISRFKQPTTSVLRTFNYYCMDGGSLLPVLVLGIIPGDSVLDMCAAPGGKTLVMAQTLYPSTILCNDNSFERNKQLKAVIRQYIGVDDEACRTSIRVSQRKGEELFTEHSSSFDKVLCDVPCFKDRLSVRQDEDNIFHEHRGKDRLRLPERQVDLLKSALKCVKPGGNVVYSTCTLSPIQNDGVVYTALKGLWEETSYEYAVCDLSEAISPLREHFKFAKDTRYGQLVVPFLPNNFGPTYFAKIKRVM